MIQNKPVDLTFRVISVNIFIAVLVPFFLSFIWLIRNFDGGGWWILFLLITIWVSDISAYYIGKNFGKHKITPNISPKKSLEGFIAGFIGGVLAAFIFYYILMPEKYALITGWQLVFISVDIVVAGMVGDLFESLLKRGAGVKDSGNIIPGHGGMLDRIDSVLFAAPLLYFYLKIFFHIN
jgi:phosphatidate cytidylyltransferase